MNMYVCKLEQVILHSTYIYIHTYIHTNIHAHTHIHTYAHTYIDMNKKKSKCMYGAPEQESERVDKEKEILAIRTGSFAIFQHPIVVETALPNTYIHTYSTHTHTHVFIHTYKHTNTYIHIHTYTSNMGPSKL